MNESSSRSQKCLEAGFLAAQVEAIRNSSGYIPDDASEFKLTKMLFRAENLAGEAGHEAAQQGERAGVPTPLSIHKTLSEAYTCEYYLVLIHDRA